MVYVNTINNPFEPHDSVKEWVSSNISIHTYLCQKYECQWEAFDRPTICFLNGEALSQKQFHLTVLKDNDVLVFCALAGGIETIILIAVLAVSVVVALAFAPQPAGVVANDTKSPNSVYNLSGQVNSNKIGQEIPCGYGKVRNYPDYAARPYNFYKNNDQYQYSIFCLGHGEYDIDDIKIGDTPIENFQDIEYELVLPHQKIDLFRNNVVTSIEAANLEILGPNEDDFEELGPFTINAIETRINKIEVDFAFPKGLYEQKTDGGLDDLTVTALISYREIDDDNNPIAIPTLFKAIRTVVEKPKDGAYSVEYYSGEWIVFSVDYEETDHDREDGEVDYEYTNEPMRRISTYYIERTTTWSTIDYTKIGRYITPLRQTVSFNVPYGRYQIKFERTNNKFQNYRFGNTLMLESVRGFMPNTSFYGNKTLVALKALATNNLNNNSAKQFNLVQTRKLRTWDGTEFTARIATRNPIWAALDALTAKYGGRISTDYIDLATFKTFADFCDANTIRFDYMFATRSNVWDIIKTILAVGKMMPVLNTSRVSIIRDYELEFPEFIYTDDNILRGSFKRSVAMKKLSDYDGLQVEFIDGDSFKQENVLCLVDDDEGTNLETIKLLGVINKTKAKKLGLYHRAIRKYRREVIIFKTDSQGYLPTLNSLIGISHNTTNYRAFDLVKNVVGEVITLANKHTFDLDETYQIIFKQRTGFASEPYYFVPSSDYTDTLDVVALSEDLSRLDGEEPLIVQFGEEGKLNKLVRVKSINPVDITSVEIETVTNDNRIYSFDEIDDDPTVEIPRIDDDEVPVIGEVKVEFITLDQSKAIVSWPLNKSARRYVIQYSYNGTDWSKVATRTKNTYVFNVIPGQIYIRVAGKNKGLGPWSEWDGILAEYVNAPDQIDGVTLKEKPDNSFVIAWNGNINCEEYIVRAYIGHTIPPVIFAGRKTFKAIGKHIQNKDCSIEFTKEWLKDRSIKREILFGRQWTFTVEGVNPIGTGDASEPLQVEKEDLTAYIPDNLDHDLVSGNIFDVAWDENGGERDDIYYKVWSSTVNGSTPPSMTLEKTTKLNSAQMTITGTRPSYWRVQVLDDWDTDETVFVSAQKTIS